MQHSKQTSEQAAASGAGAGAGATARARPAAGEDQPGPARLRRAECEVTGLRAGVSAPQQAGGAAGPTCRRAGGARVSGAPGSSPQALTSIPTWPRELPGCPV